MVEKFQNFYIYRVSRHKMRMQMRWCPSLLHWPFQSEPRREYLSIVATCTVTNFPLMIVELQEEIFKSKRFLRFQQVSNLWIGNFLTSTSSCMAYCLMIPKKQLPSEGKLLDSITMPSCKHCIANCMMESYSNAFHIKRHIRHSKKFMTVCAELTNQNPSSETGLEDLAITDRRQSLILSPMLSDAMHVRSMVTLSIKHQAIFIQCPPYGHSRCGEWMLLNPSVPQYPEDITSSWL